MSSLASNSLTLLRLVNCERPLQDSSPLTSWARVLLALSAGLPNPSEQSLKLFIFWNTDTHLYNYNSAPYFYSHCFPHFCLRNVSGNERKVTEELQHPPSLQRSAALELAQPTLSLHNLYLLIPCSFANRALAWFAKGYWIKNPIFI